MVECKNISKTFQSGTQTVTALDRIDLSIIPGEFVVLFGPNGSGKTTFLNIVAGLDTDHQGTVTINGKAAKEANVGYVFQNYNDALLPWKRVLDNVTIPLVTSGMNQEQAEKLALTTLKRVGLGTFANSYVYTLSGGQRQLVSICRAFVRNPDLLLFDEPCSALDYSTTKQVGREIQALWMQSHVPALCVSHDIDETIFLADRVVVLSARPGRVKAVIDIPLPRPRTLEVFTSPEFFALRKQVLDQFHYDQA